MKMIKVKKQFRKNSNRICQKIQKSLRNLKIQKILQKAKTVLHKMKIFNHFLMKIIEMIKFKLIKIMTK